MLRLNSGDRRTSFRISGHYRQIMSTIVEITLAETILERCNITDVTILEADIEAITETITLEEVEVGLGERQYLGYFRRNDRSSSSRTR